MDALFPLRLQNVSASCSNSVGGYGVVPDGIVAGDN